MIREWVCEANVGKASSASQAQNNVTKLKTAFQPGDTDPGGGTPLYGLCEINEGGTGNEMSMAKSTWPNYTWAATDTMVPIGAGGEWEVVGTRVTPTHGGLSGVTPNRPIVETRVRRKSDPWCELLLINSHAVAGAFTHSGQSHERERRDDWFWWWGALRTLVRLRHAAGDAVIFTGDTNRPDMPKIHDNEKRWVAASLDYVIGIDGKHVKFKHVKNKTIDLTIDGHNGHAALLELHKA